MHQFKDSLLNDSLSACFFSRLCLATLLLSIVSQQVQADEKTEALAIYLPDNINTVSVVRLKKPSTASQAERERWARILGEHFGDDQTGFLSWGETLLIGSLFHPSIPEEAWATGVMRLPKQVSFGEIAQSQNASVDSLSGVPVVKSKAGNYLVKFPADVIGLYRPGIRQDAANWIASASKKKNITIKPYLRKAIDKQGDVVLALNLANVLDPQFVKSKIEKDERFAKHKKLIYRIVPLISGLRGITLTATTGETIECEISIDFSSDIKTFSSVMKTLFLSVLEDSGAMIDEFPGAKISTSGNSLILRSQLSEESLHRILSLVTPMSTPANSFSSSAEHTIKSPVIKKNKDKTESGPTQKQRATKKYFEAVSKKIANLQRANRNAKNYKSTIAWHENFARTIERLPTKNVAREFLGFGQRTAERFRELASSITEQQTKVNMQQQTLTYQTDYDPGWASLNWWGGAGYRPPNLKVKSNLEEVRKAIAREELKGYEERKKIWLLLIADEKKMKSQLKNVK